MCEKDGNSCQEFPPKSSKLGKNMDLSLSELKSLCFDRESQVYAYVVTTVKEKNGSFCQTGCAPNFQGGHITLCTCKHLMRTWKKPEEWREIWIAGFTSKKIGGKNYLFYLMQVERAFPSFKDIWETLDDSTRTAKNATLNFQGDLYEPIEKGFDKFDRTSYRAPVEKPLEHKHLKNNMWKEDIDYKGLGTLALLLGSQNQSFLWTNRLIYVNRQMPRQAKKWDTLDSFVKSLKNEALP